MPYYVSQWSGNGTNDTPFTPKAAAYIAADAGWSCIDLRGDATSQGGWCLFWSDKALTSTPGGVIFVVATEDSPIGVQAANWIAANLDVAVTSSTTFKEAVRAIMLDGDFDNPGRWNPLTKGNGKKFQIYLGDLFDEFD